MNKRAIIPLVFGLGIGVVAVKYFMNVLKKAEGTHSSETISVVLAKCEIGPAAEITEPMIEVVPVPKALTPKYTLRDKKSAIGRVTNQTIPMGMMVVASLLAPEGTPPGMTARIPEGFRAVAVKVNEFVGVAGWIRPGSRVDVVVVMDVSCGNKKSTISKVVLENVEVLAIGQKIQTKDAAGASLARSVTLLIEPKDVPKLHLVDTKGKLRLAMRGQNDIKDTNPMAMTDDDLFQIRDGNNKVENKGPGFLGGWFSKLCTSLAPKTDKQQAMPSITPAQASLPALSPLAAWPNNNWVVEVMAGAHRYSLRFDGNQKNAKRIEGGSDRNPSLSLASARAAAMPMPGGNLPVVMPMNADQAATPETAEEFTKE